MTYVPAYRELGPRGLSDLPEWTEELTEAQYAVLEPPYTYQHPLIEDDGVSVIRPRREGEETTVLSSQEERLQSGSGVVDDTKDRLP